MASPDPSPHLKKHKNNKDGQLIDINVLEYAAIIINYLSCYHAITHAPPDAGAYSHPAVHLGSDNSSSEAWAHKEAQVFFMGRAISCLQAALIIGNPIRFRISHIFRTENVIADTLSHYSSDSSLLIDFPSLCQAQKESMAVYNSTQMQS